MNSTMCSSRRLYAALGLILLVGCTATPTRMEGLDRAERRLAQLQTDPELYHRAPLASQEAVEALGAAQVAPSNDMARSAHLLFMAERKIEIAWALAEARLLDEQREGLQHDLAEVQARDSMRETEHAYRESDRSRMEAKRSAEQAFIAGERAQSARNDAAEARYETGIARDRLAEARRETASARSRSDAAKRESEAAQERSEADQREITLAQRDADRAKGAASAAREDAVAARAESAASRKEALDLQASIDALHATSSERGWVVTLGDVLFASGRADINQGASEHLDDLAGFLVRHPHHTAVIEGHTDNVGDAMSNLDLSARRAESVKAFLISRGVASMRLVASGLGEGAPIASNRSSTGRQQNRRVEVIISDVDETGSVSTVN